jgi:hypothetical protein
MTIHSQLLDGRPIEPTEPIDRPTPRTATTRDNLVVRFWLHAEGVAAFVAGAAIYLQAGGNPWFLLPLLLIPDVSAIGYLAGPRIGAFVYDLVHNWAVGIAVLGGAALTGATALWIAGAILVAHVGMDRAIGYGLKYPTHFKDTHLQRI